MQRLPQMLALTALFAGCSIPISFDTTGTIDFDLGTIGTDCNVTQQPPENCTVTSGIENLPADPDTMFEGGEFCVINVSCTGIEIIDTVEVAGEIDSATNGNSRITTRIDGVTIVASDLVLNGLDPNNDIPAGTRGNVLATTGAGNTVIGLTEANFQELVDANSTTVLQEPPDGTEASPLLEELNTALDTDPPTPVPVSATVRLEVPAGEFNGTEGAATGSITYTADIAGRGGISLRANN